MRLDLSPRLLTAQKKRKISINELMLRVAIRDVGFAKRSYDRRGMQAAGIRISDDLLLMWKALVGGLLLLGRLQIDLARWSSSLSHVRLPMYNN